MFDEYEYMMSAQEVCEVLRIGHNTLYALLNEGKLCAFRCGRIWKIPKAAVEKFVLESAGMKRGNNNG